MLTTSTKVYLKSQLKLNVSLATIIPKALIYTSKLAYRIRLEAQKSFAYQSKLSLSCRVITDFDENAGFTYTSKLSLNLSLE